MSVEDHAPPQRHVAGPLRWWLLALGVVLTLTVVTWGFAASVASAASEDARDALDAAGLESVVVHDVSYRSVTLEGPDDAEEAAVAAVSALPLVTEVAYEAAQAEAVATPTPEPTATVEPAESATPSAAASETPETDPSPSQTTVEPLPEFDAVLFEAFSADLTSEAQSSLDAIADAIIDALETHPTLTVQVDAYSDSFGSAEDNQELTEERATNVRDRLIAGGVPPGLIETAAYGEESPVASNATEAGRAQNRRVEITLTEG